MPPHTTPASRRVRWVHMLAAALLASANASAIDFGSPPPVYQGTMVPLFPSGQVAGTGGAVPGVQAPLMAHGASQVASNARELAQAAPPQYRDQMQRVYVQSFDTYRKLEAKLGIPHDDLAAAVAAFIAGNYMAYRNVEVPDEVFMQLVAQMRGTLAGNRGIVAAPAASKRALYEQSAMVGTFMAVARMSFQQQPNLAAQQNFRNAAAANLEAVLKTSADRVQITQQGLVLE